MDTQTEINEREWRDPKNWRGGLLGIYHSRGDDRATVPKGERWGGVTFNVGHPLGRALAVLVVVMLVALVVLGIGAVQRRRGHG